MNCDTRIEIQVEIVSDEVRPPNLPSYDPLLGAGINICPDAEVGEVNTNEEGLHNAPIVQQKGRDSSLSQSPWDRLYEESVQREVRRAQARQTAEAERVARALFDPSPAPFTTAPFTTAPFTTAPFTTAAATAVGPSRGPSDAFIARQEEWLHGRDARVRQRREEADIAELRGLQRPAINESSERMALRAGHEGPIRGWGAHFAKYALRTAVSPHVPMPMFRPNINITARESAASPADAAERLYKGHEERMERLREMADRCRRDELIDPSTGKPFFHPQAMWGTGVKNTKRSALETAEDLYAVAQTKRERQTQLLARAKEEHSFAPEISERSRRMAERQKTRAQKSDSSSTAAAAGPTTPSPIPEEKTKKLKLSEFLAREDRLLARRRQYVENMEREALREEQQKCTFTPRINRHSVRIFENSQQRHSTHSPLPTAQHTDGDEAQPRMHYTPLHQQQQYQQQGYQQPQRLESQSLKSAHGDTEESLGTGRVLAMGKSPSPIVYSAPNIERPHAAAVKDSEGTQFISDFEERMKELIAEWRRLECA